MGDKPTQEELRELTRLEIEQARKEMAQEEEGAKKEAGKRYCTYEQFEESIIKYDPEKDFRPDLLCGCPAGSINIIAARHRRKDKCHDKYCKGNADLKCQARK